MDSSAWNRCRAGDNTGAVQGQRPGDLPLRVYRSRAVPWGGHRAADSSAVSAPSKLDGLVVYAENDGASHIQASLSGSQTDAFCMRIALC